MYLQWLTNSVLGVYATKHDFQAYPISLRFIAGEGATVELVSGKLPAGMEFIYLISYDSADGIISLIGTPTPVPFIESYQFTLRINGNDGTYLDQLFIMQLSPIPVWLSAADLGTFPENHSFNLSPIVLDFSADNSAKITLMNGQIPDGLLWTRQGLSIVITGSSTNISETLHSMWTFRITDPGGKVADRTFNLTLTPIPASIDWSDQPSMLGYVGAGYSAQFTVAAKVQGTTSPTYSLVHSALAGLSIDPLRGLITYAAPSDAGDTTASFTVRASLPSGLSDFNCYISVLSVPHVPIWSGPMGTIYTPQELFLELYLSAHDLQGAEVTYSIYRADPKFPFMLDPQGFVYGRAPSVTADRLWTVTFSANSINGVSYITVNIVVTKTNAPGVLVWRVADTELLDIADGRRAVYDIGAHSTRTPTVKHGIVGGQCPPGMVLDKLQGCLVGYIDYHPVDKDYWFNVTASDGIDTMTRTIHMQVKANYGYQFSEVSVPLWGEVKQRWLASNNQVIDKSDMHVNVSIESNLYSVPSMSLIRGLDNTISDPALLFDKISPSLQDMRLSIGAIGNVVVDSHSNQLIYRDVIDPQAGSAYIAGHPNGSPTYLRPPTLTGLRTAFIEACKFANNGLGSGATATATIDPEQGVITAINVLETGSGYVYHPAAFAVGAGSGAQLQTIMRILDISIKDTGTGWELGEQIFLDIGRTTRPAEIIVTAVDRSGGLVAVTVFDGGAYQQVPIGKMYITSAAGTLAGVVLDLGIDQIQVISGGMGYDRNTTTISFAGSEQLAPWQSQWTPQLPMSLVTPGYVDEVLRNSKSPVTSLLDGVIWQVGDLVYSIEGLYWQGSTRTDTDMVSWDGNTTRWEETVEPRQTLIDQGNDTFDLNNTTLDSGPMIRPDARANWGSTLIDDGTTAFDFYATVFDVPAAPTESATVVKRWIRLDMPQLSGNNITDHG